LDAVSAQRAGGLLDASFLRQTSPSRASPRGSHRGLRCSVPSRGQCKLTRPKIARKAAPAPGPILLARPPGDEAVWRIVAHCLACESRACQAGLRDRHLMGQAPRKLRSRPKIGPHAAPLRLRPGSGSHTYARYWPSRGNCPRLDKREWQPSTTKAWIIFFAQP
jgi:hypothetical protein